MKRIIIAKDQCTGCLNCMLACMVEHDASSETLLDLQLSDPANESRCRISFNENFQPTPIFCRHCDEPECVTACMSGAMTKTETGVVTYNEEQCAACFMCVMACPFGVLSQSQQPQGKILKCEFCVEQEVPRCVANCPTGAITVQEVTPR